MKNNSLLPPLREELSLFKGGCAADGSPLWVLHDPVINRFFRLGWLEFEVLSNWHRESSELIVNHLNSNTTLKVSLDEVEQVGKFLSAHNLIQITGQLGTERLLQQHKSQQIGRFKWLLKNYLFVRIPMIRPDHFLNSTLRKVQWLWSPFFLLLIVVSAVLGLVLVQRQWETFLATFPYMFSMEGMLIVSASLVAVKVLHEFGHAYALKSFGCRVPTMGVALLVLWPVLYTDASDSWKLVSRRQRLSIGAAGILVELSLAAIATLMWSFMPDGAARSAVFLIATTTWIATLLINLNPFMRFDGYYLMSDWLEIPNLQNRAFALGRWRLREALFGFGDTAPEYFPELRRRVLIIYAYSTWLYRFFLFLGIALLVYFLFFKALGIFLMIVELAWFIFMPAFNEIKNWWLRKDDMRLNKRMVRTLLCIVSLLIILLYPWDTLISLPGVWRAEQQTQTFSLQDGLVTEVLVELGDSVTTDQLLVQQHSPDLDYAIIQGQHRIEVIVNQLGLKGISTEFQQRSAMLWSELEAERSEQRARLQEKQQLSVRSNIDGVLVELLGTLSVGDWLPSGTFLATVVGPESGLLEAYVTEQNLMQIKTGAKGWFYPNDTLLDPIIVHVDSIDSASTRTLTEPYLASIFGGEIAVRESKDGTLIPETPVYRLLLRPDSNLNLTAPSQVMTGSLRLEGESRSFIERFIGKATAILLSESSF